jgi:predicted alpha/beta superfamily hydrolase
MKSSPFILLVFVCLLAIPARADDFDASKLQGLGDTRYQLFNSEQLGHPLHIYVRVPESAKENPDRRYPTVYLLDGGINYPLMSAYYHYLRLGEEVPELLLVGISYGSDRFAEGNYRSSDFTAPAPDRDYWGKAGLFQTVLIEELMPLIEQEYPSDAKQRVVYGHSLGGQFVLYAALTRPELYSGLIAANPALHRNLDFFLQWQGGGEMPINATRLFVSESELDAEEFRVPALRWIEHWSAPDRSRPFELMVQQPIGETHMSGVTEAFRQGLLWLFPTPDRPD